MTITCLTSPLLDGLPHGFLGSGGGVSSGLYASLNVGLGSGDDPARVQENRRRAGAAVLPGAALATVHQVHSADAVLVDAPFADDARPAADALVTTRPGLLIGVLTADCAPILFADSEAGVVGAAHAGWGGAFGGIIASTVSLMLLHGAQLSRICAAIGPCIAQRSYEVGEEFLARFLTEDASHERYFAAGRSAGKYQFDLEGFVALRLAQAGVARIDLLGEDTYAQETRFFSYRRTTHRKESDYGRQISLIGFTP
jgi:polyphenol oxidase